MGGTAASQKTGTGGWKQVGKERASRVLGWVREGGGGMGRMRTQSLGAESLGVEGEE